jgi:ketosteroid isomerase-like protein
MTSHEMTSHKKAVEAYVEGFRRSDHAAILGLLTDDVRWDIPGHVHLEGKDAFDGEIENPAFTGSPQLDLERLVEEGDTVVALGEGVATPVDGDAMRFAFCDVFTFRGDLIARVESYLGPAD